MTSSTAPNLAGRVGEGCWGLEGGGRQVLHKRVHHRGEGGEQWGGWMCEQDRRL